MYEAFYGLREKPFNLTPDPKYLYLSDKHKEAFAHLLFGIKSRTGFVMVTGEIGTGKTTICRNLLNQLDDETELAFVFNPSLNPVELLRRINSEFGIPSNADNVLELTDTLNAHLLDAAAQGKNCVLIIDEAQNLTPPVLEQIRLLSNLETEKEKLLQIILIGQPELLERLQLKELRQLNQRITARYHLKPLNEQETLQYVAYRLHVAGGRRKVQFARSAVRAVYKQSNGTPRVINAICDRALLIGYTKEAQIITTAIVRRAAREIRGEQIKSQHGRWSNFRRWMPRPATLVAVVLVAVLVRFFAMPLERAARELGMFNALLKNELPPPVPDTPAPTAPAEAMAKPESPEQTAERVAALLQDSAVGQRILSRLNPAQPPVANPPSPSADFAGRLSACDPAKSRTAAASALLRAWNMATVGDQPEGDNAEQLLSFAQQHGFATEYLTPAFEQLAAVDLPAFVRMKSGDKNLWLALLRVEGDSVKVSGASEEETWDLSRDAFRSYFAQEAVVLWRDPVPGTPPLSPGHAGKAVALLKEQLRRLGRLPESDTADRYDGATAMAVSKIQAETGLLIDGVAGKQVRMVLYSWLPDVPGPSLKGTAIPSAPLAVPAVAAIPETAPAVESPPATKESPDPIAPTATPKKKKKKRSAETTSIEAPAPAVESPAPVPDTATAPPTPTADTPVTPPAPATETPATPPAPATETPAAPPAPATETPATPPAAPPAPAAETPAAPAAPNAGGDLVQIQELPKPDAAAHLAPVDTSALKETTAPAAGSLPLVPHEEPPKN